MDGSLQDFYANVYAVESKVNMVTRTLNVRAKPIPMSTNRSLGRYVSVEINMKEIKNALAVQVKQSLPRWGRI